MNATLAFIYLSTFLFYPLGDCSTLTEYPHVSADYHFQKMLFDQKGNYSDPISKRNKKDLQRICQEVRESSTYAMVKMDEYTKLADKVIVLDESYSQLSDDVVKKEWREGLVYVSTPLKRTSTKAMTTVDVFSCATKNGIRYFHLTYGFLEGYFFVFKVLDIEDEDGKDVQVKITGLVEPTPKLQKFRDRRHMEKVFTNSMNYWRSKVGRDRLCGLNAIQQFRLCAIVDDARNASRFSINYAREMGHRCVGAWAIAKTGSDDSKVRKYLNEKYHVEVVPCYITNDTDPDFYLTSDPIREHSVFVLNAKRTEEENLKEKFAEEVRLVIEGVVRDVSVLKNAEEFY